MVKALCWLLLLCVLGPVAGAAPQPNRLLLGLAAQEKTGSVWATGFTDNFWNLYRFQNGTWQIQTMPEVKGFVPIALTCGEDGAVYGAWQPQNQTVPECLITKHRGAVSCILARFSLPASPVWSPPASTGLWAGRNGDVWFAEKAPMLWHVSPEGDVKQYPITPEQRYGKMLPNQPWPHQTFSLTDGQGRRWFWQDSPGGGDTGALRGVLIWDGQDLAYHATLRGVPDQAYSTLAPLDADHLWLAVGRRRWPTSERSNGGLYQLDTRTLSAVPVDPPEKGMFQDITQIFQANGDWHVSELPSLDYHFSPMDRPALLWRQRGAHWKKCLDRLEGTHKDASSGPRHSWLAVPQGVWLGVTGGVWWLPKSGKPAVLVDWRRGLPVSGVNNLFRLADGKSLAFGINGGTSVLPPTPPPLLLANPEIVSDALEPPTRLNKLIADPRGHLWGMPTSWRGSFPLYEWNGISWQIHSPPKNISGVSNIYACDTHSRVWLNTTDWKPPAPQKDGIVVYDPKGDSWTKYDTLPEALKTAAALPGLRLFPNNNEYNLPLFSGDGRVTYTENASAAGPGIALYDGRVWRRWQAREIIPGYQYGNIGYGPEFNAAGKLEVGLPDDLWEWTPEAGWRPTGRQASMTPNLPLPPGSPVGPYWGYAVSDRQGAKWLVWQGDLYETWHDLWAKQTALSGPGSPFWDGRSLSDVLRDARGRVFFVTYTTGYPELVVWQTSRPAAPKIQISPRDEDAVTLHFSMVIAGPHWFLWRMNGGEWSAPQKAASVSLTSLPRGDYRVEALALDKNLQAAPQPSVAVFSIRVDPSAQVAHWVRVLLVGGDNARETAVAGLVKQPALALPALQAAHAGASEEARWWLDAATQQIQDKP